MGKYKIEHYSQDAILKTLADYYFIMGMRSNGKTYSVKEIGLFGYHKNGININGYLDNHSQFAVIRRWEEDFKGINGQAFFTDMIINDETGNRLSKASKGKWNNIVYKSHRWYLIRESADETGEIKIDEIDSQPFAFAFALTSQEHYKSASFPMIRNILFDEVLTREYYLDDECTKFFNLLSTIIRDRNDVKIWMCANTISTQCPYFNELGLSNIKKMKKGVIDVYQFGDELKIAVEYCDTPSKKKPSNKYFAFNNENLKTKMITDGEWELSLYPHLPYKYTKDDILYYYFIVYDKEIFQCEIISVNDESFTYIHRKTGVLKNDNEHLIYTLEYNTNSNYRRKITNAFTPLEKSICDYFKKDLIRYQDNSVGEAIKHYINACRQN